MQLLINLRHRAVVEASDNQGISTPPKPANILQNEKADFGTFPTFFDIQQEADII